MISLLQLKNKIHGNPQILLMMRTRLVRERHLEKYSCSVNNLSFQESMNVELYQQPSVSKYDTTETPSYLKMCTAIRKYPEAAKNKATGLEQLRESGSSMITMLNFGLKIYVSGV